MRARRTSEPSDSTDRTKDAMNPGQRCWALRNKSANTHFSFLSVCGSSSTCLLNCVFVGAGLPGDGGSVAVVTKSASVESEGQED